MMQDTSLSAYFDLADKLGPMQYQVLEVIKKLGCPTDLEIAFVLGYKDPNKVRPRRNDLLKMGIITYCEKRICSISGRLSWTWRVA